MPAQLMELMRHESIETTLWYYVGTNAQRTNDAIWDAYRQDQKRLLGQSPDFSSDLATTKSLDGSPREVRPILKNVDQSQTRPGVIRTHDQGIMRTKAVPVIESAKTGVFAVSPVKASGLVTRATTTAPIVSLTAFFVSTTTGRGPTGGGSSAHQTSALRIGPGRLAAPLSPLDLGQLRQEGQLSRGDVSGLDVGNRFRLDVAAQGCFEDVSQSTPLMTGKPPQLLLNLIAHLNDHACIVRSWTNLGN